jgi:single-strand DNA-binding protein
MKGWMQMNLVAMIGNTATEPEFKHTPGGKAVCTFRLAVSRPGGDQADFVTVVAWERQAEVCAQYLQIGRRVAIEGRLHHSVWKTEDGERRSRLEVVAHRVHLLGAKRDTASRPAASNGSQTAPDSVPTQRDDAQVPAPSPAPVLA